MSAEIAHLGFLHPLFELIAPYDDPDRRELDLPLPQRRSQLDVDDRDLEGFHVSGIAASTLGSAVDHVSTLRSVILSEAITIHAPWTLLRAVLEASAAGAWVACPQSRHERRSRALRLWRYDFGQRATWHRSLGETEHAEHCTKRAKSALELGQRLHLRDIELGVRYSALVHVAAGEAEIDADAAVARWREASAFAHGRMWPHQTLEQVRDAQHTPARRGLALTTVLDERRLERLAQVAIRMLDRGLTSYSSGCRQ